MSDLEQMYQQVILDHAKRPHGRGLVAPDAGADADGGTGPRADLRAGESHQVNPTCGDEVTLRVRVDTADGSPRVAGLSWEGQGCSISQASVSVMHDLVVGADLATVDDLSDRFRALMGSRGAGLDEESEDALGDAAAFTGVGRFPARVKCALLGWSALTDALIKSGAREDA